MRFADAHFKLKFQTYSIGTRQNIIFKADASTLKRMECLLRLFYAS